MKKKDKRENILKKWLKKSPIIILLLIIGIIIIPIILIFGDKIPNLLLIIHFWTVLTAYIILFYQLFKEKEKDKNQKNIAITQIENLVYFIYEHLSVILTYQNQTQKRLSNLEFFYSEVLRKINCFFNRLSNLTIYTSDFTYYINPVEITKVEKDEYNNITGDRNEIDKLIKYLRESV